MNKKAFTLFELMVVVMIIGIVYALVLGNFNPKNRVKVINLEHIKDALTPYWKKGIRVDLVIYDKCKKSALLINGEPKEDTKLDINLKIFKDIKTYKLDRHNGERDVEFPPILVDKKLHKVCFDFTIFPNGSNSSFIVQSGKKFYLYRPYFEGTYVTTKLDDALEESKNNQFTKITAHE